LLLTAVVSSLVSGCGKTKPTKSNGSDTNNNSNNNSASLADGTWVGACKSEDGVNTKETYVIAGNSATRTISEYSDANCSNEKKNEVMILTFTLGGASSVAGAYEVTSTVNGVKLTLKDANDVQVANEGAQIEIPGIPPISITITPVCGGGFTINVPKELTSNICKDDPIYSRVFGTIYGLVKIDGDKLYFGESDDDHDGSAADKRPVKLGTDIYTKQAAGGGGTGGGTTGSTTGGTPESAVSLAGNWVSVCGLSEEQQGVWVQDTLEFTEDAFAWTQRSYSDANCVTQSDSVSLAGTYTIGDQVPSLPGAYELDAVISQSGYFDIVKVDGDKLYMGEHSAELDGSSREKRPMVLGQGYYQKQP
jgi:hypothetical protein